MSINVLKAWEPRLDIEDNRTYVCMMGGASMTISPQTAQNISLSQIQWTVTTPSTRTGVDRRLDKDTTWYIDYNNIAQDQTNSFANPYYSSSITCGPRQYPLASTVLVENFTLNDQLFGWEPCELVAPLQQYGNEVEDRQYYCAAPHMPDMFFSYDVSGLNAGPRNPYSNYFQNVVEDSRAVQFTCTLANNDSLRAANNGVNLRLICRVREPTFISPFYYGKGDYQALFGIQKIGCNLSLVAQSVINRFMGGALTALLTNPPGSAPNESLFSIYPVQQQGSHILWLNYITPHAHVVVPPRLVFPFFQISKYTQQFQWTTSGSIATNNLVVQPKTVILNNITLHEIPKRIYHFARQNINGQGANGASNAYMLPDFYAGIQQPTTVNFDNVDGRLSNIDTLGLWKMSVKNGLKRSWIEFSQTIGSVICFELGTDITLSPLLSQGVRGNFQYAPTITFYISPAFLAFVNATQAPPAVPPASFQAYNFGVNSWICYTVTVPDGVLMVDNQLVTISVGGITEEMLSMAPFAGSGFRQQIRNMYGGAWYNKLWDGIKKVFKYVGPVVKKIANVTAEVLPYTGIPFAGEIATGAKVLSKGLEALGAGGRHRRMPHRRHSHSHRRHSRRGHGTAVGGRKHRRHRSRSRSHRRRGHGTAVGGARRHRRHRSRSHSHRRRGHGNVVGGRRMHPHHLRRRM